MGVRSGGLGGLGELETRVMRALWRRHAPATVREVQADLGDKRELAYTTVMTVMDRLRRKGMLRRVRQGRAFQYEPVATEAEYTAKLMHGVLSGSADRRSALAHFVRGMRKADEAELIRLAKVASRRKRTS